MGSNPLLLSLKSWPDENPEVTSVSSLISQIQAQRGHFRDVNESILEAEIAAGKDEAQADEKNNDEAEDRSDKAVEKDSAKELTNAKLEMANLVACVHLQQDAN